MTMQHSFIKNGGSFHGFGDTKFIPRIPKVNLREITKLELLELFVDCIDDKYSLEKRKLELGYSPEGVTTYYEPSDITKDEVESINKIILSKSLQIENTIFFIIITMFFYLLL